MNIDKIRKRQSIRSARSGRAEWVNVYVCAAIKVTHRITLDHRLSGPSLAPS
jgi:hypothetical protein